MMKTIVVTGPEASGKSVLSSELAAKLGCEWSEEYAREYLMKLERRYSEKDLTHIAQEQKAIRERQIADSKSNYFILDTDFLVLYIWSLEKFGRASAFIQDGLEKQKHSLYLLCRPDLEWADDPLRENPHDRDRLFERYLEELRNRKLPFAIVEGTKRCEMALDHIYRAFEQ